VRENLKKARKAAGLTQQKMAEYLKIHPRYYKALESGERLGGIELWDKLERLFGISQMKLREISGNRHVPEDSQ